MRATSLFGILACALFAVPLNAAEVNVSQRWCGGDCSEGHNDTQCICTYNGSMSQSNPAAWVQCEEVSCCSWDATYCDLGYVHEGSICDYPPLDMPNTTTCGTNTPRGFLTCEVGCGESGCYVTYRVPNMITVNEEGSNYCTRSNETCDWWAPWTCFEPCSVPQQSPWDDSGSGLICG